MSAGLGASGCLSGDAQPIVRFAVDSGPFVDAGVGTAACPVGAPLTLYYRAAGDDAGANSIDYLFKVANNTGASLPLASLAVRYYFTNEITPTWQTSVYYAGECCSVSRSGFTGDVGVSVNALSPATATADHYIEATFDADAGVVASGDSVQVEIGFFAPGHDANLDQSNDYSFIASANGTQAEWDLCPTQCAKFGSCVMTVYENGNLMWGTPP